MTSAQADDKKSKMPDSWSGVVRDTSLRGLAPDKGYVADDKTWKNLWHKWRGDQSEPPKIDFTKGSFSLSPQMGRIRCPERQDLTRKAP